MKKFRLLMVTLPVIVLLFVYNSNFMMFNAINYLDDMTHGRLYLATSRDFIMKVIDDINPLKGSIWKRGYNLPEVNLTLNKQDLEYFQKIVLEAKNSSPYAFYMPNEINIPINTKMRIDDREFKIELKIHGTNNPHFKNPKKSYAVKIRKKDDKEYPYGMRRFALVIPSQSNLVGMFTYRVADLLGMLTPNNFLVRVYINGVDQGVYHLEEKLNKTLLERNGLSGYDIVRSDDSWAHQYANNHGTMFSFDYSGLQPRYMGEKNYQQMFLFKKLFNSDDINFIKQHINLEKFIKYDVLRYIFGDSGHMTSHDNIKFIYSTSSGRLEPYFRIENHIEKILSNKLTFSPEQHVNIGMFTTNNLLSNLTKDDEYRHLRNQAIFKLLEREQEILGLFDSLVNQKLDALLNDTTNELPTRYFQYEIERARDNLVHNFKFLRKYLEYSRVFVEIVRKNKNIHEILIKPDSNAGIRTDYSKLTVGPNYIGRDIELINHQTGENYEMKVTEDSDGNGLIDLQEVLSRSVFSLSLDDNLEPKKSIYKYILKFDGSILNTNINFVNDLTDLSLLSRDIYNVVVDESAYISSERIPFIEEIDKANLLLKQGNYVIEEDLVLPYGMNLIIEKGTTIILKEGVSLLVRGGLDIQGTRDAFVRIQKEKEGSVFGVFAAIGDSHSICKISFLDIFGGSEDILNGIYLSGALSLYNHKTVDISNSRIHHNVADDGLNIKNAEIFVKDNNFFANSADQVDIDTATGIVSNNFFSETTISEDINSVEIVNDSNGDGLDLSDSKVIVDNNTFEGFLDKGISIGENTQSLIFRNIFNDNRSALTAKDQSKAYLANNIYADNEIDVEMYQKKLFFTHPSVFNLNEQHDLDKISKTVKSRYFLFNGDILNNLDFSDVSIFDQLENLEWIEYE